MREEVGSNVSYDPVETAVVAVRYVKEYGFSVIPVLPNKKPLVAWEPYQSRYATEEEIGGWWAKYPQCMVGIVTGRLSNLVVLDVDTKEIPQMLKDILSSIKKPIPSVSTPRGSHYYFNFRDEITNTVNLGGKKMDIRGEGGFVITAPSQNGKGGEYIWTVSLDNERPEFPEELLSVVRSEPGKPITRDVKFTQGNRDDSIFHLANSLARGGMPIEEVIPYVLQAAAACDPPFSEQEALQKVDSAFKRTSRRETAYVSNAVDDTPENLAQKIREYIKFSTATFSIGGLYNEFNLSEEKDKTNARVILCRCVKEGLIETDPRVEGRYRKIQNELEIMKWDESSATPCDVALPFGVEEFASLYAKNIAIIAGNKGSGKTTSLLKFALDNADKHKIYYAVSDMGEQELKVRIELFEKEYGTEAGETFKKVTFFEKDRNYADTIKPNDINVIDYLEVVENFAEVGRFILDIWSKLDKGIAMIAIQKSKHKELGRGADFSLEKARLYLSLTHDFNDPVGNTCKIISVKNYRKSFNPHGLIQKFKIIGGTKIIPIGAWHHKDDEEDAAKERGKRW